MSDPELATTASSGHRHYRDNLPPCPVLDTLGYDHQPDVEYPSVTTIIGHGIPKKVLYLEGADRQPVSIIDKWGVREVAEYAVDHQDQWAELDRDEAVRLIKTAPNRTRDQAARRGSDVHDIVEKLAAGLTVPSFADDLEPWIASARAFVADFRPKVVWSETTVFNRQFGYAGTLDLIADFPGHGRLIADYKTSSRAYGSTCAQLAAYRHAEYGIRQGARSFLPDGIEGGVIVNLAEDGYQVVPAPCGPDQLDAFLNAMGVAHFCHQAEDLLGAPLRPVDHSGDDLVMVKAWLRRRVEVIAANHPTASQALLYEWPQGTPTLGKDKTHTADDLAQIEAALDRVEAAHDVPFGETKPAPSGTHNYACWAWPPTKSPRGRRPNAKADAKAGAGVTLSRLGADK